MRLYEVENTKGSYAAVKFSPETVKALEAYQFDNNIPNPLAADEFHSTVMFSRKYIPEFELLDHVPDWEGIFTKFGIFDSDGDNALVLKYDCHELSERFDEIIKKYDATWDHPSFIPHITLSYNVEDLDPSSLPKFEEPIIIVSEFADDLDLGWQDNHK
jgi:hypothetical protein